MARSRRFQLATAAAVVLGAAVLVVNTFPHLVSTLAPRQPAPPAPEPEEEEESDDEVVDGEGAMSAYVAPKGPTSGWSPAELREWLQSVCVCVFAAGPVLTPRKKYLLLKMLLLLILSPWWIQLLKRSDVIASLRRMALPG